MDIIFASVYNTCHVQFMYVPFTQHALCTDCGSDICRPLSIGATCTWNIITYIDISLDSDIEIIYYINADVSAAVSLPSSEQE